MIKLYEEIKTAVFEIKEEFENFNREYDVLVRLGKLQPDREKIKQIYRKISLIEKVMEIGPKFIEEKIKIDVIKYSLGDIGRVIAIIGQNIERLDLKMRFFQDVTNRAIDSEKRIRNNINQILDRLPGQKMEKSIFELMELEAIDIDVKNLIIYLRRFRINNLVENAAKIEQIIKEDYNALKTQIRFKDEKRIASTYEELSKTLRNLSQIFNDKVEDLKGEDRKKDDPDLFQVREAKNLTIKINNELRKILGFRLENKIEESGPSRKWWQFWK